VAQLLKRRIGVALLITQPHRPAVIGPSPASWFGTGQHELQGLARRATPVARIQPE
jgi:hypothetical protein